MSSTATAILAPPRVAAAIRATYAAFIASGFAFASWASRIPQVRDRLHLSPAGLGLVLLSIAAGSLVALPLAGVIVHRLNSRRTVASMSVALAAGLGIVAVGYLGGVVPVLGGLFVLGFANGAWDVAMNVQGATVERHLGRSIMPRFHAGYSAGTVAGALLGVLMVAGHVSVTVHLLVVAALIALVVPFAVRAFVADVAAAVAAAVAADADVNAAVETDAAAEAPDSPRARSSAGTALARWREPRTLVIGVVVLAFAFSEGSGNDWITVALIDGYHAPAVVGTLCFATFLAAMTGLRWFGTGLLDRYGRVPVLRGLAAVAVLGLLLFVFSPYTPLAFAGAALWGCGASLGFPVGMSAAADDPAAAASRVSVVASIGYCAFLGGPPLIGFLGDHLTVLRALLAVVVMLAVATVLTNALRPLPAGQRG
ncbi:MAG: MFS transporter [Jatrophihabitans sp.]